MEKHKKIIKRAFLVIVLVFVAFFGFREMMSFVSDTSSDAEVERRDVKANKTTTGENCSQMNGYYNVAVKLGANRTVTISVDHGAFVVGAVSMPSAFVEDPTQLGVITPGHPISFHYQNVTADVMLNLRLVETDDKCLSYDDAKALEEQGKQGGTYSETVTLNLYQSITNVTFSNSNYNGICAAFRDGTNYNEYSSSLSGAGVSQSEFEKYNYAAVDANGKNEYENVLSYCFSPNNVKFNYTEKQVASMIRSAIDIYRLKEASGNYNQTPVSEDFMAAFNDAKNKALALGHDYTSRVSDGSLDDSRFGMVCDWQKKATGTTGDAYYVNKDYYYAKEEDTEGVSYTYHYTGTDIDHPGNTETVSGGACKRTCEESVVVEYGPPVASKAGLCFEYKVKVTSRVICESDISGIHAPTTPGICSPTPVCQDASGSDNPAGHEHQGGPNEEFEQCIAECDGGKYSTKCSNQCYKEVYGKSDNSLDPLAFHYDVQAKRLGYNAATDSCDTAGFPGYSGRYQWENGSIVWVTSESFYTYARYYHDVEASRTCTDHGRYAARENGFKRRNRGNGNFCSDTCFWVKNDCTANSYMNQEDAAKDTVQNMKKYNQAITQCQASASCTTKTAYFEISVDYTHDVNGTEKKETISFPYNSSEPSKLPSLGKGQETASPGRTEIFLSDDKGYQGYDGCYVDSNNRNWYQAEWSFPGTWINNKTGDITFVDKSGNKAWHLKEDKFCVPLDAKSVNTIWWEWSEVGDSCYPPDQISNSINYNIHASTTDFGYFGWNFDFECFYALRNEVCDLDQNGCCLDPPGGDPPGGNPPGGNPPGDEEDPPTTISTRDYAFRIIDTSDMFPETDNKSEDNTPSIVGVGRQPGYNWTLGIDSEDTSILTTLNAKNPDYKIDPLSLINNIQQRQSTIYNGDTYVDYKFVLDTETLAKIREFNRNKKYTDFDGDARVKNGVTVYYSDLWNVIGDAVVVKGKPGINNEGQGDE